MPFACDATPVQYAPYEGWQRNLGNLPWIAASPSSSGLLGHLFYWGGTTWGEKHQKLHKLCIYTRGQAPGGRLRMKILWELRSGSAWTLSVRGTRLDAPGRFAQSFEGGRSFPSIVVVPTAGCWSLTVKAGKATGHVTVLAVSPAKS